MENIVMDTLDGMSREELLRVVKLYERERESLEDQKVDLQNFLLEVRNIQLDQDWFDQDIKLMFEKVVGDIIKERGIITDQD